MSQCVSPLDHPVLAGHLWATTGSPGCDCYSISSINQYGHYYSKDGGRLMRNTLVKIRNSVSFWKGKCYTHYNKSGHYYIYQTPGKIRQNVFDIQMWVHYTAHYTWLWKRDISTQTKNCFVQDPAGLGLPLRQAKTPTGTFHHYSSRNLIMNSCFRAFICSDFKLNITPAIIRIEMLYFL